MRGIKIEYVIFAIKVSAAAETTFSMMLKVRVKISRDEYQCYSDFIKLNHKKTKVQIKPV